MPLPEEYSPAEEITDWSWASGAFSENCFTDSISPAEEEQDQYPVELWTGHRSFMGGMGTPGSQTTSIAGSINSVVEPSDRIIGSVGPSMDHSEEHDQHPVELSAEHSSFMGSTGTPGSHTTSITGSINSVVGPSMDHSTPMQRHITLREPLIGEHRQLSPEEQQERFKRMTDARTKQFQSRPPARGLPIRPRDFGSRARAAEVARSTEPSVPTPVDNTSYDMSGWGNTIYDMSDWGYGGGFNRPTDPQWFTGPTEPGAGGPADLSALESAWAQVPTHDLAAEIDTWDTDQVLLGIVPDPSNVGETARHASRLLDAFTTDAIPPMAGALSAIQQRLLSTALTTILSITQDSRVDTAAQTDPLPPPPVPVDVSLRPDAACVVCLERVVDTVLVPCWHLVLCAVSIRLRESCHEIC